MNITDHEQLEVKTKLELQIEQTGTHYELKVRWAVPGSDKFTMIARDKSYENAVACMESVKAQMLPITVEGSNLDVKQVLRGTSHE